ncbi:hypothetical protein H2201_003803 [Coniosporium apollinis]|uniref:PUM-HD domain-containing protein n=1 Tax=Coniosporium apollinis TaxID=61459 RepID=A0ABQ9NUR3_9PEZI|nr:hypothetical protein H2201_003803 [Coniosporium apollinis]
MSTLTLHRESSVQARQSTHSQENMEHSPMDQLLVKLSEQQILLERQTQALTTPEVDGTQVFLKDEVMSSGGSISITSPSDKYNVTPTSSGNTSSISAPDAAEMLRLRRELEDARSKIARMDQELSQSRITKHTMDQAMGPPSEIDFHTRGEMTEQTISHLQLALNASTRPTTNRHDSCPLHQEDARSGSSDALSDEAFIRTTHGVWANNARPSYGLRGGDRQPNLPNPLPPTHNWNAVGTYPTYNGGVGQTMNPQAFVPVSQMQQQRPMSGNLRIDTFRNNNGPFMNEPAHFAVDQGFRRSHTVPSRPTSAVGARFNGRATYPPSAMSTEGTAYSPSVTPLSFQSMTQFPQHRMEYQPQPIGTRLSPRAQEFSAEREAPTPWSNQVSGPSHGFPRTRVDSVQSTCDTAVTYVPPTEPMNYRLLLDRNMTCNWKYIVDKIVCNNDQQASIFLQQKLKVGTTEQKYEIIDAIIGQAFPLMINRFGNFLVQRCFEHGTPEQVVAIANAIRGNTLTLSMDAFGCHVVQKAFDAVPEEYKAVMVHELLRRIPETVIHRYACHVWQKLFELRWSDSPPQIMKYVNEALRGMWHEVALGETASLVVQNIFENCLEEDKRPCINEVLASIDVIAHGQFGNWCIQHICEHGVPADRSRAIDHILRFATEYSMDQYASKVIEKCLKIGGNDFMERYLERICEGRLDRPRMPLIDIAGDQFGNYLMQYILTHANPQHRDIVANHIRKHMVSLRGSKYGSRVALLCCNPAFTTRPGPPAGMQLNRFSSNLSAGRGGFPGSYR